LQSIGDEAVADKIGSAANKGVHAHAGGREPGVEINLMEFEAELNARTCGEKSLPDEGNGMIEQGRGRKRAAARDVKFLEDCQTAWTKVLLEFAKCIDRVGIVHEDEAADHGIEGLVEGHFGGIAFEEAGIAKPTELGAGNGPLQGGTEAVGADDFTAGTDEIGDEEGDIAGSTPDIENPHAGGNSSLLEELTTERFEGLRWATESMEFQLGVA
jgi:hypothetical protein